MYEFNKLGTQAIDHMPKMGKKQLQNHESYIKNYRMVKYYPKLGRKQRASTSS